MPRGKIKKLPVSKYRFLKVLREKRSSIRRLGDSPNVIACEKTIRRNLDEGCMQPDLLDSIGQELNVDTRLLEGKMDKSYFYGETGNEKIDSLIEEKLLRAEDHPYQYPLKYDISYDMCFRGVLYQHGLSDGDINALDSSSKSELQDKLDQAVTGVLRQYFPGCTRSEFNRYEQFFESSWTLRNMYESVLWSDLIGRSLIAVDEEKPSATQSHV